MKMMKSRGKTAKDKLTSALIMTPLYAATVAVFYLAATRSYQPVASFDPIRMAMFAMVLPLTVKYLLQLCCLPFYSLVERRRRASGKPDVTPSVSVLIPAWNEEVGIVKTIKSVLDTQYPRLQIVVINDGSTDGTHQKVTQFISNHKSEGSPKAKIDYINIPNCGKAKALNRGLREAGGEVVVTIDADCIMADDAITNLVKRFGDPDVGAVAGHVVIGNRTKPIEWMQELEYLYGFFFKRADSLFNSVYIIGGAAAAYRRKVLQKLGGFDHDIITEDIEMSTRILKFGYKTRYAADAVVYTECPSDLKGLCNQRLRWRYGRILTFMKHRKLFFSTSSKHHPYLTFLLMPMAAYAELLLLVEAFMISAFFIITIITSNYLPLTFVITLLSSVFFIQVLVDTKRRFHRNLLLLAPVTWLVFYVVEVIEIQALFRSLKRLATRQGLKWQKWARVGILDNENIGQAS